MAKASSGAPRNPFAEDNWTVIIISNTSIHILLMFPGSGVLVGSYLPTQLLGSYIAPTPVEEGDEEESRGELDIPWMLEHAKQVLRMLPG